MEQLADEAVINKLTASMRLSTYALHISFCSESLHCKHLTGFHGFILFTEKHYQYRQSLHQPHQPQVQKL